MDSLHFSAPMNKFSLAITFTSLNFFPCWCILFHLTSAAVQLVQMPVLPWWSCGKCSCFGESGRILVLGLTRLGSRAPKTTLTFPCHLQPPPILARSQDKLLWGRLWIKIFGFGQSLDEYQEDCAFFLGPCGGSQLLPDARR